MKRQLVICFFFFNGLYVQDLLSLLFVRVKPNYFNQNNEQ